MNADTLIRVKRTERMTEKVRAVEALERAVCRWKSERKVEGADASLLAAMKRCEAVLSSEGEIAQVDRG